LDGVPFTVCWMFSIAKLVWRLVHRLEEGHLGLTRQYTHPEHRKQPAA